MMRRKCPSLPLLLTLCLSLPSGLWALPRTSAAMSSSSEVSGEFMRLLESDQDLVDPRADTPEATFARLDSRLLRQDPAQILIPLPDGRVLVAYRSADFLKNDHGFTWQGQLQPDPSVADPIAPGAVRFFEVDGRLYGTVQAEDGAYFELMPEGELHRLVRHEASNGQTCGLQSVDSEIKNGSQGPLDDQPEALLAGTTETDCFTPLATTTLDVMVLYPRSLFGSATTVTNYAAARIAEANTLFNNSGVRINYRLVYVGPITGAQPPGPTSASGPAAEPALTWLTSQFVNESPAIDTEVELLRKAYGADMITLIIPPHGDTVCGIANLAERDSNGNEVHYGSSAPFAGQAFTAVELNCGNGDYTFAHELGHTLGMRHDNPINSRNILPWSYGYIITLISGTRVATVMGCTPGFNVCSRIGHFSNPDIAYDTRATGLHSLQAVPLATKPAHNACVANLRAPQYANFAVPPPTTPPSLNITAPADNSSTAATTVTFTATATDAQDGDRRAFVQWTSDRQGALGTGSPLTTTLTHFGRHLITATVSDSSGTRIAKSILLNVTETVAPQRWIDFPTNNQLISGVFNVVGWTIDSSGVDLLSFAVDGQAVTLTNLTDAHRPDVCAAFPTVFDPRCPRVGFQGQLNTGQLTNGTHSLTLTARDIHGNVGSVSRTFRTQNQSTSTISPIEDAWVNQEAPNTNYGADPLLKMRASGSNMASHAYLKFNITGITRPVISAKLTLRTYTAPWDVLHVYRLATTSWGETTVTWNNGPLDPLGHLQFGSQPANSSIKLDITPLIVGNGTYTLGLVTSDNPGHGFYSRESVSFGPILEIKY